MTLVFPSESMTGIEQCSEMVEATHWELSFTASRAREEDLGHLEVRWAL